MNRFLTTSVVLTLLAAYLALFVPVPPSLASDSPVQAATGALELPSGAAVFEMKYRGLSGPDDPLAYHSFWGFGDGGGEGEPFVQAVKSQVKECAVVGNRSLQKNQWSVVELKDKKPIAFYFDVNADGKLSDDEKFLPAARTESNSPFPYAFMTSDFAMHTEDQREIPFRVVLVGNVYDTDRISYMWSPACVLEGQATLAGEPLKLFLYADGFRGSFTTFGSCSYVLLPAGQKLEGYLPRSPLSSLVYHKGTFYQLKLSGAHEKGKAVQVAFTKDTTPTGRLAITLQGKEPLKARVGRSVINGATGNSIYFEMPDTQSPLPEGRYRLTSGSIGYGVGNDSDWQATFSQGPPFEINAGKTRQIELGGLTLSVGAVDEKERYRSDVKQRSTYAKGTSIYLSPQIKGKAGEVYTRFDGLQDKGGLNSFTGVKPHVTIRDPDGKMVASTDMEYG
jgi:hypothetical protein